VISKKVSIVILIFFRGSVVVSAAWRAIKIKVFGNASIFGLSTFGFALAMLGFWLLLRNQLIGALIFALLVAAIGETVAGLYEIVRGQTYVASVLTTFGIWLVGCYLLLTVAIGIHLVTDQSIGLFILLLHIPVAYLAVPAFVSRRIPLVAAFVFLFILLMLAGLGSYFAINVLNKVAIVFAFLSAISVWFVAFEALEEANRPS
jgi:succinate-acetate transporter protein